MFLKAEKFMKKNVLFNFRFLFGDGVKRVKPQRRSRLCYFLPKKRLPKEDETTLVLFSF